MSQVATGDSIAALGEALLAAKAELGVLSATLLAGRATFGAGAGGGAVGRGVVKRNVEKVALAIIASIASAAFCSTRQHQPTPPRRATYSA